MGRAKTAPSDALREGDIALTRVDGYVPLESYAVLGDGRTVALVARDGRIDWWPLPTLSSPPAFAAVINRDDGGYLAFAPREPFSVERRYVERTNVLETTYTTSSGKVTVRDTLCVGKNGLLPWVELVRSVQGVSGSVPMEWQIVPGDRFGQARPWTQTRRNEILLHLGDQSLGVRAFDVGEPTVDAHRICGSFDCHAGHRGLLSLSSSDRAPVFLSDRKSIEDSVQRTIDRWQEWSASIEYDGPWRTAVCRSAVALKLLLYTPTGAIAAAATTSLPERIGGDKNWDYRYSWIRDSSFSADALISLGLHEEVQAAVTWLLQTLQSTAPDLHVFYTLDGDIAEGQVDLAADGYRGSRPVRAGNGAAQQSQLGTYGDLFDTLWRYVSAGHVLDPQASHLLVELADRCCDVWLSRDSGIWELPEQRHYTISKMGCWVALDRAVRLTELGEISSGHAQRWRAERTHLKDWIDQHCWSERKKSYTFYAGTDELDAATLLAARTGFETGERLAGTIDAVRAELGRGPLVYRYTGMDQEEGAFLACTYWLVEALAVAGRRDEACALMDEAVGLVNDVGLLAEQMDPRTGEMLGNLPQGLSHLSLINAAVTLHRRSHTPA
jgi:GH15 family glucan-1,4-alpha-glucosidase